MQKKSVCQKFFLKTIKLFLKSKKEFSSCSLSEISKFHIHENKANAHVDTFNEPPTAVRLDVFRQTVGISTVVSPFFGAWVARVYRV